MMHHQLTMAEHSACQLNKCTTTKGMLREYWGLYILCVYLLCYKQTKISWCNELVIGPPPHDLKTSLRACLVLSITLSFSNFVVSSENKKKSFHTWKMLFSLFTLWNKYCSGRTQIFVPETFRVFTILFLTAVHVL